MGENCLSLPQSQVRSWFRLKFYYFSKQKNTVHFLKNQAHTQPIVVTELRQVNYEFNSE